MRGPCIPGVEIVKVSCLTGNGLHEWLTWLERRKHAVQAAKVQAVS